MSNETGPYKDSDEVADQFVRLRLGPMGSPDELIDMRGLTIAIRLNDVKLKYIDISEMRFAAAGNFYFIECCDCRFDQADLRNGNVDGEFAKCSFRSAKLGPLIGRFEGCDFEEAEFIGALASEVVFDRCSFRRSVLRRANLYRCVFINCDWTDTTFGRGSVSGSRFEGTAPTLHQLGRTVIEDVAGLS